MRDYIHVEAIDMRVAPLDLACGACSRSDCLATNFALPFGHPPTDLPRIDRLAIVVREQAAEHKHVHILIEKMGATVGDHDVRSTGVEAIRRGVVLVDAVD